jgi:glycosyltransferase involved in cell wall biosynthesis
MISVVVATYGDYDVWGPIAERALASTKEFDEVIYVHGETLASARNAGARKARGERLVFLDADDELAPGFKDLVVEEEDILQPLTIYRQPDGTETEPHYLLPYGDLYDGNHIVIGAPINRELMLSVGGFDEYPVAEDWALWLKMRRAGATFGQTKATYIVNVNHNSRNLILGDIYMQIRRDCA